MISFIKEPINEIKGILIFSEKDEYVENYEKISNDHLDYLESYGENPFMAEEYWNKLEDDTINILKPHLKKDQKILDIGVGLGRLLSKINLEIEKHGVDISISYLEQAKQKGINVILSKIEELPYPDNYFDVIVTTDVLEHVLDLNKCVNQIQRVLKPEGILLIRVPNEEDLQVYLDYDQYKYVHLRRFDESGLRLFFEKVYNFQTLESKKIGFIRSNSRLITNSFSSPDNLVFWERLVFHFRQGMFDDLGIAEFVSKSFDEYNALKFRLKNRFLLRQFFKGIYWLFSKMQIKKIEPYDYYREIELTVVFKLKH